MFTSNFQALSLITLMGVVATLVLDLWAASASRAFGWPRTNWALVGRWFSHLPRGKFRHAPISATTPAPLELVIGWCGHYLVGVAYAMIYMSILIWLGLQPTVGSAILFGVITILAPWMILQPGMGLGFFASSAPNPPLMRKVNFAAHSVFGLGLYGGWWLLAPVIQSGPAIP